MLSIGEMRLRIDDYFESLISQIDLRAETLIARVVEDESIQKLINKERMDMINAIKQCKEYDLTNLNRIKWKKDKEPNEKSDKKAEEKAEEKSEEGTDTESDGNAITFGSADFSGVRDSCSCITSPANPPDIKVYMWLG